MRGREILCRLLSAEGMELFSRTQVEGLGQSPVTIGSCAEKREDICRVENSSRTLEKDEAVSVFSSLRRREASFSMAKLGSKVVAKSKPTLLLSSCDSQVGGIDPSISRGFRHMDSGNAMLKDLKEKDRMNGSKVPESPAFERYKPAVQFCQKGEFIYIGTRCFFEDCLKGCFRSDALMTRCWG
jgi:hypothetical protein